MKVLLKPLHKVHFDGWGAVGQMGSAIINGTMNLAAAGLSHRLNEKSADNADERTRNLYNDLYSPQAKTQQLKNAGLSVGLMYGNGGPGGTSSTSGAQAAPTQVQAPNIDLVQGITQAQLAKAQADLLKSQKEGQDIDNQNKQRSYDDVHNTSVQNLANLKAQENETLQNIKESETKTAYTQSLEQFQQIQNEIAQGTKDYTIESAKIELEQMKENLKILANSAEIQEETKQQIIKQAEIQTAQMFADIALTQSQTHLNYKQAAKVEEEIWKIFSEIAKLNKETEQLDKYLELEIQKVNDNWNLGLQKNEIQELSLYASGMFGPIAELMMGALEGIPGGKARRTYAGQRR